ncbi:MAG: hypothetical protein J5I59_00420 [Saprospiraceae bacterium]|nr:hypothetical protein [Saprospiraceae bacterium]
MTQLTPFTGADGHPKTFIQRPEGKAGLIVGTGILIGAGYLLYKALPTLITLAQNTLYLAGMLIVLGALLYMVFDPKMRNLIWYMYKSIMRTVTGWFVQIDPIGILKSYIEDLENNLKKMGTQIGNLKGQMRKLQNIMDQNKASIDMNLKLASKAKETDKDQHMILSSRKAARLTDTNEKYQVLYQKMEVLYRILTKMYSNSEILLEDTRDQVKVKEQERAAIRASHSAMKSAMNIISGNSDKRVMFDQAMESIADDVAMKVGEMERFMEMSTNFMDSIDLQNAVFEEDGMRMLEQWEKESTLLLSGSKKTDTTLDLNAPKPEKEYRENKQEDNNYDQFFEA